MSEFRQATSEVTGERERKKEEERERTDAKEMWPDCVGRKQKTHSLCIN